MHQHLRKKINNWRRSMLDGKFLHMRWIAHVINLVVSDDLKMYEIRLSGFIGPLDILGLSIKASKV